jgi:hypothetical protein
MSAKDRRTAGVRDFKSIRVKKDIAQFVQGVLEPLLTLGVTIDDITDLLAEKWKIFPDFEGFEQE